ncbi:MAG TPA: hypothetical protein VFA65_23895 [Bryobacteraceae bacterium]|nr:hypothetical protein [Bryobacteraceae bacterium]
MEEEKPACLAEIELVKKMAEHTWCSERASRLQEGRFGAANQTTTSTPPQTEPIAA